MKLTESDVKQIESLLDFIAKTTFELSGSEVVTFSNNVKWLVGFKDALSAQLVKQNSEDGAMKPPKPKPGVKKGK